MVVELQYCKIWYVRSSIIFAVLHHWVPGNTNCHAIAMAEKANCNKKKPGICDFNYDNNGGES